MSDVRAYELFRKALEADDREAFLASCGDLRPDVEALLAAHDEGDGEFLETPARERLWSLEPGERIGRYTIKRKIATGGGGTVYEARQERPRRTVALKVLPHGTDRIAEEAEVLARLQHPGIATVHEAGRHEGALYVAMEFVDGSTLSAWARGRARAERLSVFARVCDAVHLGHVKGVVHRDLKPGNILVSDLGPKVIDFGIAAPVGGAAEAAGTPAYMSPEQLEGGDLDARTDVYSLGVVLKELEADAPPDLAAVIGKATANDREDRYASAAEFGADVRRFLRREPVTARPASWPHLLALFIRRRPAVAVSLLVVFGVLAAGIAVSMHFAFAARAERDEATRRAYVGQIALAQNALRGHDVVEARRMLDAAPAHLRGWEWRHLKSVLDLSSRTIDLERPIFAGTVENGRLAAISGNRLMVGDRTLDLGAYIALCVDLAGDTAACGTKEGAVLRVDLKTGGVRAFEGHEGPVNDVRLFGERLASAGRDGTVRIDGEVVQRHRDRAVCVTIGPEGGVVSGCRDGTIRARGRTWKAHEGSVEGLALSPDGRRLASVSRDQTLRVWDLNTGRRIATGWGHLDNIRRVAWRGEVIATASYDRTVRLWNAADAMPIACLRGHEDRVRGVGFLDANHVVSFGDRTAKVWRVANRDVALRLGAKGPTHHAAFEGPLIRSASTHGISWWSRDGAASERVALDARWSDADDDTVRAWQPDGNVVFWSRSERRVTRTVRAPGCPAWRAVSRDFYAASGPDVLRYKPDRLRKYRAWHDSPIRALALAPTGGDVATACDEGRIRIHNHDRLRREARPLAEAVAKLVYSPSGKQLAAIYRDGAVLVLQARDLAVIHRLKQTPARAAAFHPAEPRLATGGEDGLVRLWNTETGEQLATLHAGIRIRSVEFDANGHRLLAAGGGDKGPQVIVWSDE